MAGSQSRSIPAPGDAAAGEQDREVLQASLFLSVMKHTGNHSRGDQPARAEDLRASSPHAPRSDPPIVRRLDALIDSIGRCLGPFEKEVTVSDLNEKQDRLILWTKDVELFVKPLLEEGDDTAEGVEVTAYNTEGKAFPLRFKFWGRKVHVLMGNWKAFVRKNQLELSDVLKIWAFRDVRTQGLCFVIARRRRKTLDRSQSTENRTRSEGRNPFEPKPRKALLPGKAG